MRDLTPLFDPRSVAVVGASADRAKWGYSVSEQLLSLPSGRDIYLVNRRGGDILGRTAFRNLADLPAPVDLVAICVPASGFLDAVRDSLAAGARALVAITAGLGEADAEGEKIEREAVALVRSAGAVLVGPNCLGVTDSSTGLRLASDPFRPGDVAVLSQSGNMVLDLEALMADEGLGLSRFVSLGNQADVAVTDFMLDCVGHDATHAVAIYAEDVMDGRAFVQAARALAEAGKPVVLLAPGSSDAGRRGAASHTGSLTSADNVIDAACTASGIHRVHTPLQMVDALVALRQPFRAASGRVGILTDGGGHGSVAADSLHRVGLDVPLLSAELGVKLSRSLWSQSSVSNPVDLAGIGEQDLLSYARGLRTLLDSDEVAAVLLTGYFGGYAQTNEALAGPEIRAGEQIADIVRTAGKPVVVHTIFPESDSIAVLRGAGVPVHRDVGRAAAALAMLVETDVQVRSDPIDLPPSGRPTPSVDYVAARSALSDAGIAFPRSAIVKSEQDLDDLLSSAAIGFPLVMKAMGLLHKSDAGGVVLDIADEVRARAVFADLVRRLQPSVVSVEQMVDHEGAVEVIVGSTWDPRFGPVLMVGLGGVLAEVMEDVAFALAPVTHATASRLLHSLRGAPLLTGVRGRAPIDMSALVDVVVAVSEAASRHPDWVEVEVNPVIATPTGAVAVDARIIPAQRNSL
ncbi:MAG: acetate--CoA ligase family protein [Actinomycetes bacterium]